MTEEFAGRLQERVTIERRMAQRDAAAGARLRWRYDGAAWVGVSPLMPATLAEADALSSAPRWQIFMRKREGIDLDTRFVWRGRFLSVLSVVADPRTPGMFTLTTQEQR